LPAPRCATLPERGNGIVEAALACVWSRLRPFIPPESAGLVVFLIGVIIGLAALRLLLDDNAAGTLAANDGIVAGCTLAVMIGLNIWSRADRSSTAS
jgi:hypothetical protein